MAAATYINIILFESMGISPFNTTIGMRVWGCDDELH